MLFKVLEFECLPETVLLIYVLFGTLGALVSLVIGLSSKTKTLGLVLFILSLLVFIDTNVLMAPYIFKT